MWRQIFGTVRMLWNTSTSAARFKKQVSEVAKDQGEEAANRLYEEELKRRREQKG